jgi:arsenite methyltransferase
MDQASEDRIKEAVRGTYGSIARNFVEAPSQASCCGPQPRQSSGCCSPQPSGCGCGPSSADLEAAGTAAQLYGAEELAELPESVSGVSLGCGNPTAVAELQPGEVVLDLGSGGGIDCFLAARQVGPEGRVIGLDMTPEMIKLARRNAREMGVTNVDFRFGEMEEIPLPDESVDVIISNCVINLSPDKDAVFGEAYRVLHPGGRLSVSDIVVDGELPPPIRDSLNAWAGCIAGALDEEDYLRRISQAGFQRVSVESRDFVELDGAEWVDALTVLDGMGLSDRDLARKVAHKVASIKVKAYKPAQ